MTPQQNNSTNIDLRTSNLGQYAAERPCSFRPADGSFPSYEELYSFWVQWKDRDKWHCGMESMKFREKDFFQSYISMHKLLMVSANFILMFLQAHFMFFSQLERILNKKGLK